MCPRSLAATLCPVPAEPTRMASVQTGRWGWGLQLRRHRLPRPLLSLHELCGTRFYVWQPGLWLVLGGLKRAPLCPLAERLAQACQEPPSPLYIFKREMRRTGCLWMRDNV